jgi:hypothetical protein
MNRIKCFKHLRMAQNAYEAEHSHHCETKSAQLVRMLCQRWPSLCLNHEQHDQDQNSNRHCVRPESAGRGIEAFHGAQYQYRGVMMPSA